MSQVNKSKLAYVDDVKKQNNFFAVQVYRSDFYENLPDDGICPAYRFYVEGSAVSVYGPS
jgi:hypothetical protein